jgi:hypothetical protein
MLTRNPLHVQTPYVAVTWRMQELSLLPVARDTGVQTLSTTRYGWCTLSQRVQLWPGCLISMTSALVGRLLFMAAC